MYTVLTYRSQPNWNCKISSEANKLNQFCMFETDNVYGLPEIISQDIEFEEVIPFPVCHKKKYEDRDKVVHFFCEDLLFEKVWTNPKRYIEMFQFYKGMIAPNFSIMSSYPFALNLYNLYRGRWLMRFYQEQGIKVIADAKWLPEYTEVCFSDMQKGCPIVVSTVGKRDLATREFFKSNFESMLELIEPSKVIVYGNYMPLKFEDYGVNLQYVKSARVIDYTRKSKQGAV